MNNINSIAQYGICIGCMECISVCPKGALDIKVCDKGFPIPIKHEDCDDCGTCLLFCPFVEREGENSEL